MRDGALLLVLAVLVLGKWGGAPDQETLPLQHPIPPNPLEPEWRKRRKRKS